MVAMQWDQWDTQYTHSIELRVLMFKVVGTFCMDLAIEKAKKMGVAWVTCTCMLDQRSKVHVCVHTTLHRLKPLRYCRILLIESCTARDDCMYCTRAHLNSAHALIHAYREYQWLTLRQLWSPPEQREWDSVTIAEWDKFNNLLSYDCLSQHLEPIPFHLLLLVREMIVSVWIWQLQLWH